MGGPSSILHEDGASTAVTGILVFSIAEMTAANGSRTSPEKLKPACGQNRPRQALSKGSTKDSINYMVGLLHAAIEVIGEVYVEIPELRCKTLCDC